MKKAIFSAMLVAVLTGIGWHYASPRVRERLLGFIGMASRRDMAEVRRAIGDAVLPENPVERRQALTAELSRRIRELRMRDRAATQAGSTAFIAELAPDAALASATTADVLAGAADIVKEMEDANKDASLATRVTERILERILPARECKAE